MIGFALLIIGLGYTIILLSWQWLLHASNISAFKWVRNTKLNCFIEAYQAPYRPKYHFWTGILLLLLVILNILISLNTSGSPQYNLLTTGIVIGLLVMLKTYIGKNGYKKKILDYIENICYFNLLLFTVITFYTQHASAHKTSTYISISTTLVLFLCIMLYHIHYTFSRFTWYRKVFDWILNKIKRNKQVKRDNSDSTNASNILKFLSTEVTLSNSTKVLTSNDNFRYSLFFLILLIAMINIQPLKKQYLLPDLMFAFLLCFFYVAILGTGLANIEKYFYYHTALTILAFLTAFVPLLYITYLIGSWLLSKIKICIPCL